MGDEVDVRMFQKSGYKFEISDDERIKARYTNQENIIEALRINQYESQHRSMSTLVRDVKGGQSYIFVKGAPEKLMECSVNKIDNFDGVVFKMSSSGLRLIAYGYKKVDDP